MIHPSLTSLYSVPFNSSSPEAPPLLLFSDVYTTTPLFTQGLSFVKGQRRLANTTAIHALPLPSCAANARSGFFVRSSLSAASSSLSHRRRRLLVFSASPYHLLRRLTLTHASPSCARAFSVAPVLFLFRVTPSHSCSRLLPPRVISIAPAILLAHVRCAAFLVRAVLLSSLSRAVPLAPIPCSSSLTSSESISGYFPHCDAHLGRCANQKPANGGPRALPFVQTMQPNTAQVRCLPFYPSYSHLSHQHATTTTRLRDYDDDNASQSRH